MTHRERELFETFSKKIKKFQKGATDLVFEKKIYTDQLTWCRIISGIIDTIGIRKKGI